MHSKYRYHGFLKQIQNIPDAETLSRVDHISFSAEDIEHWKCTDDPTEKEWLSVPVRVVRTEDGTAMLRGHFEDIRRIDNLDRKEPRFWAPLSITSSEDPRFPLDCLRYPIVEVTYCCASSHAYPACYWSYPGGSHLTVLEPSREWVTAALLLSHQEFPRSISQFSLRLYSAWRTTEVLEISRIQFRALTPEEKRVLSEIYLNLENTLPPQPYTLLDEFLPFGVTMNIGTAQQLAELLDISFFDYFRLAFEDIARHHHNAVSIEGVQHLKQDDRHVLTELAENFGLRLVPCFNWDMAEFDLKGEALVEEFIKPHVESRGILAWNVLDAPPEQHLGAFLKARDLISTVDKNHPLAIHLRQADAFAFYAPYFAASGFSYFRSGNPWGISDTVRTHLPLMGGYQFWITAPTFVYASDAPDWCTNPQLRMMLNLALAHGARGWFAHTYHNTPVWINGHYERSLSGPFLTFSDLWAELGNRIERLSVLAPLFLSAHPIAPPDQLAFVLQYQKNAKTQLDENREGITVCWLEGPDYFLYYFVNNDPDQVTSVNLSLPETLPYGLEVYDTTALVRIRSWEPSPRERHLEMFPGQGQLLIIAQPPICAHWREIIGRRMLLADQRQTRVDLELARQYRLDLEGIESTLSDPGEQATMEDLKRVHEARERLFNLIYATPEIYETRGLLIKASSIICGCDERLNALHGKGKTELAHELGVRILPLARTLTVLRLQLRRGYGARIRHDAELLVQSAMDLLREIWSRQ